MTIQNRLAVVFVLAFAVVVLLVRGQDQTPASPAGRFKIVTGDYVAISGSTLLPEKGIFRVDTATGKVWKFETGVNQDRKFYQAWRLITE